MNDFAYYGVKDMKWGVRKSILRAHCKEKTRTSIKKRKYSHMKAGVKEVQEVFAALNSARK